MKGEDEVWRPRAIVVWREAHGEVPPGMIVHHENRDTMDDRIENLALISRADHLKEHRPEFEERRALAAAAGRWGSR